MLSAYEAADAVLIVRVLSLQKIDGLMPVVDRPMIFTRVAKASVVRVYKGNLKIGDPLSFTEAVTTTCPWSTANAEPGTEILVYLKAPHGQSTHWFIPGCGRTKPVLLATEDLHYLDNMEQLRGKTRVSGTYGGWDSHGLPIAQRRIRIAGQGDGKVYETFTNEKGFFEVYDLPPGAYRLEPEIPEGWRIDRWSLWRSESTVGRRPNSTGFPFVLDPKKHASVSFLFEPDNAVEGRIVGPNGEVLRDTCAYIRRPDEVLANRVNWWDLGSLKRGCTDEKGRFRIEAIEPGTYVVVLNVTGKPRSAEPFPTVFYPGTTELEKATRITIAPGEIVKDVKVTVPVLLKTVTVEGILHFSDGRPVPSQEVRFEPVANPELDGLVITETDEQGRFSLKILKGLQGPIYGGLSVEARTIRCPEIASLNFGPHDRVYVRTPDMKIEADGDRSDLVLRLNYPNCLAKR